MIPKNAHPVTDAGISSTEIEIWMPLEFDIPDGGTSYCETTHDYPINHTKTHTDIEG